MKTPLRLLTLSTILLAAVSATGLAAPPEHDPTKAIMQAKLRDAQSLLASIATGDFNAMSESAGHLVELSNHTNWYSRQTPEYELFLNNFRRNAEEIVRAANAKNLDAASLAYVQLTLSCVSCHKYMRVPPTAALPQPRPVPVTLTR